MVKPGYKQTEIGVIPEDWKINFLPSFGDVVSGGTPSTSVSEYWDGDIAWCTPSDITRTKGTTIAKTERYITVKGLANSAAALLPPGCVLLCTRATIGDSKINSVAMATNQGFKNIIPKNCNITFLFYLLQTKKQEMLEKAIGSTFLEISKSALCSIPLQYPPIPEQQRIAEALSDMDELIASLEKLIEKKKAIKHGAMQELLTGKRRLPGFSGEWNAVELRKLGRFVGGGTPSTNNLDWWKGKTPWISSSDLEENQIRTIKMSRYITEEAISHSATNLCPAGAILVVSRVGVGKVAVAPVDLCTSQDFTNIIVNNCNPFFLAYTLSIVMKEKAATTQGTSIKGVTSDEIASIKVRIPSKLEQDAIVNALESIDQDIGSIEKQYLKSRQIKHGMMQQLLTGKIRV